MRLHGRDRLTEVCRSSVGLHFEIASHDIMTQILNLPIILKDRFLGSNCSVSHIFMKTLFF